MSYLPSQPGQQTSANSNPVVIANDQSAVPVSGSVTANIGSTNGLSLDSTLTGGTQKTKLVDSGGTNVATVSSGGALKVDGSAATQPISGSVSVSNFPATQAVSGTVTANATLSAETTKVIGTVNVASSQTIAVTQATPASLQVTATPITITKGTQGTTGYSVQDLKDSGRNQTNYFMAGQVVSTASEALQSLTGYKSGAAVGATTTPAVVTSGKTYRIQTVVVTYIAVTTAGSIQVNLRANTGGVVAVTSPLVCSWLVGGISATAGVAETVAIDIPDGLEFAAGTGIGIGVLGIGATGTAAAVGYAKISITGYEY